MSEKYKFHDPNGIYFITSSVVHWIDLFTRKEFKHIVLDALKHCQKEKGLIIHAWVIMPCHLHLIISSNGEPLENIMRDFKKHVAKTIIKHMPTINESRREWLLRAFLKSAEKLKRVSKYKVWQDGNHPILLDSNSLLDEKVSYIHSNPVEDEIIDIASTYLYSSARDYEGKPALILVDMIESWFKQWNLACKSHALRRKRLNARHLGFITSQIPILTKSISLYLFKLSHV